MNRTVTFFLQAAFLVAAVGLSASSAALPQVCNSSVEPGPCYALMPRFFFNSTSMQCEDFIYGGCQGNDNNFKDKAECEHACASEAAVADDEQATLNGTETGAPHPDVELADSHGNDSLSVVPIDATNTTVNGTPAPVMDGEINLSTIGNELGENVSNDTMQAIAAATAPLANNGKNSPAVRRAALLRLRRQAANSTETPSTSSGADSSATSSTPSGSTEAVRDLTQSPTSTGAAAADSTSSSTTSSTTSSATAAQ